MKNLAKSLITLTILATASAVSAPAMAGESLCKAKLTSYGYNAQTLACGLEFKITKGTQVITTITTGGNAWSDAGCKLLCNSVAVQNPAGICGNWNDYLPKDCNLPTPPAPTPTPTPPAPPPTPPASNPNPGTGTPGLGNPQSVVQIEAVYTYNADPAKGYCVLKNMRTTQQIGSDYITDTECKRRCNMNDGSGRCTKFTPINSAPVTNPPVTNPGIPTPTPAPTPAPTPVTATSAGMYFTVIKGCKIEYTKNGVSGSYGKSNISAEACKQVCLSYGDCGSFKIQ